MSPFNEGIEAYKNFDVQNPYKSWTLDYKHWNDGWEFAKRFKMKKERSLWSILFG